MKTKGKAGKADKALGKILRGLREALDLTREDVGKYLGITFQQVQKYEVGMNRVPVVSFFKMCGLYKVSGDTLAKSLGYEFDADALSGFSETQQEGFSYSDPSKEPALDLDKRVSFLNKCFKASENEELCKKLETIMDEYQI